MKIKISPFDKVILKNFSKAISIISSISTIVLITVEIDSDKKPIIGFLGIIIFIFLYIAIWLYEISRNSIKLSINNTFIYIKIGDLFSERTYKVIGANEYFDILIDNKIVPSPTLLAKYLQTNYSSSTESITELNEKIRNDKNLENLRLEINDQRIKGNKQKYKLGSIFIDRDEYLITAFSKSDENNKCYLTMKDYCDFLFAFWYEADKLCGGKSITMPLLGAGMTRFNDYTAIRKQELLESLLWSFKLSQVKYVPPEKVTIIITKDVAKEINFSDLKKLE